MILTVGVIAQDLTRTQRFQFTLAVKRQASLICSLPLLLIIELLFDVPRTVPICHIHGCYEQGSSLVFGYRNNQNRYASAWADLDEEHWDYYVVQQREAVYGFYASWEKKLEIGNLMSFLSCCKGIDRVVVLGHSMSEVDAEYMEQVEIYLNPNVWEVSYYEPNDIARVRSHGYSFQRKINFATMDALLNG